MILPPVITFDDVQQAEKEHGGVLAKPHPFMFVKPFFGKSYPDKRIIASDYDKNAVSRLCSWRCWGDILSAKAAGMKFIAVLTGIGGQNARDYFVRNNADLILDSVLDIDSALA